MVEMYLGAELHEIDLRLLKDTLCKNVTVIVKITETVVKLHKYAYIRRTLLCSILQ